MGLGFFALTRLPLPEAITLNYAQPLLVVVFSSIFLGEAIRVYRWSAVAVGLVGVLIISWPELTLFSSDEALDDRRCSASSRRLSRRRSPPIAMLLVRNLVQHRKDGDHRAVVLGDGERHVAAVAAVRLAGADAGAGSSSRHGAGFCGGLAQILMTAAYRHAEASVGGAVRIHLDDPRRRRRLFRLRRRRRPSTRWSAA